MYSQKAIDTLNKINSISIDPEIDIVHHYIFHHVNRRYTYNVDYIDNKDGTITGYVLGMDRNSYIISKDNFKIETDGNIIQKGVFRNFAIHKKIIKEIK
jgi:hypothetical protein